MTPRVLHVCAEVLAHKRTGGHHLVTLVAPGVADLHRPGTFAELSLGGPHSDRLHRHAFWILRANPSGTYGGTVELLVTERGPGTRWLIGAPPGTAVPLTAPLGRPFALPKEPVTCTLVAFEEGVAAVLPLAARLKERGCAVHVLLGASTEPRLYGALDLRRTARTVQVATADGSVGRRGELAELLPNVLDDQRPDVVYAAGPVPLLRTAAVEAEARGAWSQLAYAGVMPCGTGHCQGCLVPVVGEDGIARNARACTDGPVFRGDRVRWDEVAP